MPKTKIPRSSRAKDESERSVKQEYAVAGRRFTTRLLSEADLEAYRDFFNELSEETIRCRFGHLVAKLTASSAKQRIAEDASDEKAFALFESGKTHIIAIGRCLLDRQAKSAEIALVVADRERRLGLGRFLLNQLLDVAYEEQMNSVSAYIATPNAPVIKLLQSAGFVMEPIKSGEDVKLVLRHKSEG